MIRALTKNGIGISAPMLSFFILLFFPKSILGQVLADGISCGNKSNGIIQTELSHEENESIRNYRIKLNNRGGIPVVVHFAYDPTNQDQPTSVSEIQIRKIFEELNAEFGDPFHFIVDKMIEVTDTSLYLLEGDLEGEEYQNVFTMFGQNSEDQFKIHVYFPFDSTLICGLASFPISEQQGIIVSGNSVCAGTDSLPKSQVLIHEFGHFFNLHHTFHNSDEPDLSERVVRDRRCKYQGDGFCDTPADFFPSYLYQDFSNVEACIFDPHNPNNYSNLTTAIDMEGKLYNPNTSNHMSYFTKNCRKQFTAEQRIMLKQAFDYRTHVPSVFSGFNLYPNPAKPSDNVKINLDDKNIAHENSITYQIRIFNTAGQEISSQTIIGNTNIEQTLSSLQNMNMIFAVSGTYLVNVILTDSQTQQVVYQQTEKLIIIQ